MASRKTSDLCPEMRDNFAYFEARMKSVGIPYLITCTKRTQAEQDALYAQGRTKPGQIVTWTLKSKHIEGKAVDIVILVNGKPDWSLSRPDLWKKAGELGKISGLTWGGSWRKNKDFPHFEI